MSRRQMTPFKHCYKHCPGLVHNITHRLHNSLCFGVFVSLFWITSREFLKVICFETADLSGLTIVYKKMWKIPKEETVKNLEKVVNFTDSRSKRNFCAASDFCAQKHTCMLVYFKNSVYKVLDSVSPPVQSTVTKLSDSFE